MESSVLFSLNRYAGYINLTVVLLQTAYSTKANSRI